MVSSYVLEEPSACTDEDLREFERLVRLEFRGSDDGLPGRIHAAQRLAFHRVEDGGVAAIAGLKAPPARYRRQVFAKAGAAVEPDDFRLELGWVYVLPAHRRRRVATDLCGRLLAGAPDTGVFATTRPNNEGMIRILHALDFTRTGEPYPRRDERLCLFVRSGARA